MGATPVLWGPNRWGLAAILGLGFAVRVGLALGTDGVGYDLESYRIVDEALRNGDPLRFYREVNESSDFGPYPRWPYPTAFLPIIAVASAVARLTSAGLDDVVRLSISLADIAIAFVVQSLLAWRGASARERLAAAAVVAFGPAFVAVSGFHGQLDAVAILPAVVGLAVWERSDAAHRAVLAGLLIGLGGAIKTVPLLMVLALLPSARSTRERVTLIVSAALVPAVAMLPFVAADPVPTLRSLQYRGAAGLGGLSLLVQPSLPTGWLAGGDVALGRLGNLLRSVAPLFTVIPALAVTAIGLRRKVAAPVMATLVWLTFYVTTVNFFMQYLVWGLPFFLMAGHIRKVALLQLGLLPAVVLTYAGGTESQVWLLYTPAMILAWAAAAVALGVGLVSPAADPEAARRAAPAG